MKLLSIIGGWRGFVKREFEEDSIKVAECPAAVWHRKCCGREKSDLSGLLKRRMPAVRRAFHQLAQARSFFIIYSNTSSTSSRIKSP